MARATMLTSSSRTTLAIAFSAILALPRAARADDAAEVRSAKRTFEIALDLEDHRNWAAAVEAFRQVAATRSTPQVHYHLGLCLRRWGHFVEAAAELARARDEGRAAGGSDAAIVAAAASGELETLQAEAPRLVVRGELEGILVSIDGAPTVKPEAPILLDAGTHTVRVRRDGRVISERAINADVKEPVVELFVPARDAITASNEQDLGRPRPRAHVPALALVAGGVALAALGAAAVTALVRASAISSLDAQCAGTHCFPGARDDYDRARTATTATDIFLGVGGVAAAAAVAFVLFAPSTKGTSAGEWRGVWSGARVAIERIF